MAASFVDSDVFLQSLGKVSSIPPVNPNYHNSFIAKGCGVEITLEASSGFEAATKFVCFLQELSLVTSTIEIIVKDKDHFVYDIVCLDGAPVAELRCVVKNLEIVNQEESVEESTLSTESFITNELPSTSHSEFVSLENVLQNYFGFQSFRPLQRETITTTLKGENVLTVVGTGGGKSMMFLLPAVISSKPTLVLSPIKSLIDDLLLRCIDLNISVCKFTGDVPKEIREQQLLQINNYKVILTTPEMLDEGSELHGFVFQSGHLERIVVDEVHTVVNWGSTFRPLYCKVCEEIGKINSCPKLLLSASVPLRLEAKLHDIFGNFKVYRSSVFRDNLCLEVKERTNKFIKELEDFITSRKGQCGIIYCVFPYDVSKIHADLLKRNINCVKYHGQLSEEAKHASFTKWMDGDVDVIVANSSFGMGIDKSNVRYVIHSRLPTGMDDYFQQCGRAGRDGLPSTCLLYYNYSDKNMLYKLFEKQGDIDQQLLSLNELINYLENPVQCRHKSLMSYYGECHDSFLCQTLCDNCRHRGIYLINDGTTDAYNVIQVVVELTGRTITCNTLKLFLAGSRQKCILEQGLDSLSNFGVLGKKFVPVGLLATFLHSLIFSGILAEVPIKRHSSFYLSLILGPKAHDLLAFNMIISKYEKR